MLNFVAKWSHFCCTPRVFVSHFLFRNKAREGWDFVSHFQNNLYVVTSFQIPIKKSPPLHGHGILCTGDNHVTEKMRILQLRWKKPANISSNAPLSFGPFNSTTQIRWKKPANTAQTRLENRTRDPNLDKLTAHYQRLKLILNLYDVVYARKRGPFVSVQSLSKWATHAGFYTITAGDLLLMFKSIDPEMIAVAIAIPVRGGEFVLSRRLRPSSWW